MERKIQPSTGPGAVVFETHPTSVCITTIRSGSPQRVYVPNGQWADVCNAVRDIELLLKRRALLAKEIGLMVNYHGVDEVIEAIKAHQREGQNGE